MMLLHHQEGVNLAKAYLKDGKVQQVRKVADEIVEVQTREVAVLKKRKSKKFPGTY